VPSACRRLAHWVAPAHVESQLSTRLRCPHAGPARHDKRNVRLALGAHNERPGDAQRVRDLLGRGCSPAGLSAHARRTCLTAVPEPRPGSERPPRTNWPPDAAQGCARANRSTIGLRVECLLTSACLRPGSTRQVRAVYSSARIPAHRSAVSAFAHHGRSPDRCSGMAVKHAGRCPVDSVRQYLCRQLVRRSGFRECASA
jgi:hypothetical protein